MDNYVVRRVIDDSGLRQIHDLLNNENIDYEHGVRTYGQNESFKETKENYELICSDEIKSELDSVIFRYIDADPKFSILTAAQESGSPLFSKTFEGGFYHPHHDSPINGHFSTTIFLNNPDDYGGGELRLFLDGSIKEFKLDAGYAITYRTGIPHEVKTVTSGERTVCVFWTKSKFDDPIIRGYWSDLYRIWKMTEDIKPKNIEDAIDDPYFMIESLMLKMQRDYASSIAR